MKKGITKAEARAFKMRWEAVNAAEREELQTTPLVEKFRQLAVLMASVNEFGWTEALTSEEGRVRDRWNQLRRIYNV